MLKCRQNLLLVDGSGVESEEPTTVMNVFKNCVDKFDDVTALRVHCEGAYVEWT